jgi:RNA polymerase sigma factor (TIGR02999 family)
METNPEPSPERGQGGITRLLAAMRQGDAEASEELFTQLYCELRRLAAYRMAQESPGHTLQPTALVHEAWLRLVDNGKLNCPDRAYFFAAAGEAMRRILVENARRKKRLKRGGNLQRVDLEGVDLAAPLPDDDLLVLDEALTRLSNIEPRAAQVVDLHMFVGLTQQQVAKELGISVATVEREWAFCRGWLFREIQKIRSGQG